MATIKQWKEEIARLSVDNLNRFEGALFTIRDWGFFFGEYEGLESIIYLLQAERMMRKIPEEIP